MSVRRIRLTVALALGLAIGAASYAWGGQAMWLARAAVHQAELLWGRVPIEDAIAAGHFTPEQVDKLRLVPQIKTYGEQIGLSATDNYDTINPVWSRTIFNVSASEPLAFRNKRWWFPVVGAVPYLGFFDEARARGFAEGLESDGYDVWVRTAGAYSTLGWFRDPLTPNMLAWREEQLANTILHELAHATVWIPGSVQFNESFANFVGDQASQRYMIDRYGEGSEQVQAMRANAADRERWRAFMRQLYRDLDAVYTDAQLSDAVKRERKEQLFASVESRLDEVGFADPDRWKRWVLKQELNNATMMQFRTYNRSSDWFAALLARNEGDLLAFMHDVRRVTAGAADPYRALAAAVGADPDASEP